MRVAIVAVGRLKAGPERDLVARYVGRIAGTGRAVGIAGLDISEIDESRARRAEDRRAEEGRTILTRCPDVADLVALDERGRDLTSEAFAALLARHRDAGRTMAFAIGGPDGFDASVLARATLRLRFGAMTVPHQFVRVLLAEQIYRAVTILAGHPYHRGGEHRDGEP